MALKAKYLNFVKISKYPQSELCKKSELFNCNLKPFILKKVKRVRTENDNGIEYASNYLHNLNKLVTVQVAQKVPTSLKKLQHNFFSN